MAKCIQNESSAICYERSIGQMVAIVISVAALFLTFLNSPTGTLSAGTTSASLSLPLDLADNSYQEIQGYTGQLLISSQTAQAYDPERDVVYLWGGHPIGGGFPQPDELFIWSVANGSFTVPRPANLTPSAQCIGAGPSNNIYDEALHGYLKIGNLLNMKGQWYRVPKMVGVMQIYTPADNDWHYMNPLGLPESQPYTNINTGGCRVYDRLSGTFLYGTPASDALGGGLLDSWSNRFTLMGGWNWLIPHVATAGEVVFDPVNKRFYLFDAENYRATKWYTVGNPTWTDKTPGTIPPEWTWNGSVWVQGTTYPPQAKAATAGTTMDAAAAWDELNNKAIYFIPIAAPRAGTENQEWSPNKNDGDSDQSLRPTLAGGGWQGYRYTSLNKFTFAGGDSATAPAAGHVVIQGSARATIYSVVVTSGSFAGGNAVGTVYFAPTSWNTGAFSAGAVNLYQSNGSTLIKASFANLVAFQTGGVTGRTEPTWPTGNVVGQLIQDGTMTWCVEAYIGNPRIEVWNYEASSNTWTKLTEIPTLVSHRAGDFSVSYIRKHNLFFLVDLGVTPSYGNDNRYHYYRYLNGTVVDYPKNPSAVVNASSIALSWDAVSGASGYNVYRGSGSPATPWTVTYTKVNGSPLATTTYTDNSVSSGNTYFYHITAIVFGVESRYSPLVRSDTRAIWDGYVQVDSNSSQTVHWTAAANAGSYNVYRAAVAYSIYTQGGNYGGIKDFATAPMRELIQSIDSVGSFTLIASGVTGTSHSDTVSLAVGTPGTYKIYAYRVTGVNALGVESGPSAYWLTIPDQPRRLQWTETWAGSTGDVALKWSSPPQAGMSYRIYYSVNGDAASMKEATTDAISSTNYTITNLPKALSAIYVTAVDSLGQEGIPSPRADIRRPSVAMWDSYGYLSSFHLMSGQPSGTTAPGIPTGVRIIK
jgi:hypothetical protein